MSIDENPLLWRPHLITRVRYMAAQPILLCLNDQENTLFLRKMALEKEGFHVLTATTAEGAFQQLSESHVDLVIADQILSDTTGTALAKEMKGRWPKLPIILLSGVVEKPRDLGGIDAFVSKAQGRATLVGTIRRLLMPHKPV